jgi:hypothetical protein
MTKGRCKLRVWRSVALMRALKTARQTWGAAGGIGCHLSLLQDCVDRRVHPGRARSRSGGTSSGSAFACQIHIAPRIRPSTSTRRRMGLGIARRSSRDGSPVSGVSFMCYWPATHVFGQTKRAFRGLTKFALRQMSTAGTGSGSQTQGTCRSLLYPLLTPSHAPWSKKGEF